MKGYHILRSWTMLLMYVPWHTHLQHALLLMTFLLNSAWEKSFDDLAQSTFGFQFPLCCSFEKPAKQEGWFCHSFKCFPVFEVLNSTLGYYCPCTPILVTNIIRDKIASSDPDIEGRRDLFEDIFARLEIVGKLEFHQRFTFVLCCLFLFTSRCW